MAKAMVEETKLNHACLIEKAKTNQEQTKKN